MYLVQRPDIIVIFHVAAKSARGRGFNQNHWNTKMNQQLCTLKSQHVLAQKLKASPLIRCR